jgi:7-cyano-7-deazaguanine synthase
MLVGMSDKRQHRGGIAVLCSAGLDSAVLLADLAAAGTAPEGTSGPIVPVYVSVGLWWEPAEREMLARLLASAPFAGRVAPAAVLSFDMRDVYPASHWAIRGTPPASDTPDEDVYLVGRNLVLLTKAAVFSASHGLHTIAIGPLAGNPFPDATREFFDAMARAASRGLAHDIEIVAPYVTLSKANVIRHGRSLGVDLSLTLSCMNPQGLAHCGKCSKCRERDEAFAEVGESYE